MNKQNTNTNFSKIDNNSISNNASSANSSATSLYALERVSKTAWCVVTKYSRVAQIKPTTKAFCQAWLETNEIVSKEIV